MHQLLFINKPWILSYEFKSNNSQWYCTSVIIIVLIKISPRIIKWLYLNLLYVLYSCTSNFVVSIPNLYSVLLPKSCLRQSSSYCPRNTSHFTFILYSSVVTHKIHSLIIFYLNYITKLLAENSVTMHNDMKCMKYI